MNRHDRRMKEAQQRRDREQARRLPDTPGEHAAALKSQLDRVARMVADALPGRPFILVSAPVGMPVASAEHVASVTNMPREHAARLFEGLLDWWRPSGAVVQPDHRYVTALREGVHMLRDIPLSDIRRQAPVTFATLIERLDGLDGADAKSITEQAANVAVEMLSLIDRFVPVIAVKPEGIPMPPPPPPSPREWPKGNTKETLPADLEQKPQSEVRDRLIAEARAGRFHDFDSDEVCGKMIAVGELRAAGYHDLVQKVIDGAYDDERPTIAQEEEMRSELGPELYDKLMGAKPRPVS